MGWTFTERPKNVRAYLTKLMTWEGEQTKVACLDLAVKLNVAYAAVETIDKASGKRDAEYCVLLLRYIRGDDVYNFGYKDLSENWGPREKDCPLRTLDLLTPTTSKTAEEWRAECRRLLERKIAIGSTIEFDRPVWFTDGYKGQRFTVQWGQKVRGRRKKLLRAENGRLYRISGLMKRGDWHVVDSPDSRRAVSKS